MSGEEGRWEGPHTDAKHWAEVTRLRAQVAGLAAVIEQARAYIEPLAAVGWSGDLGSILDSADTDAALRERDRATAERAWNELYVTQFDGAPFEMSDTTGITDPNNPYREGAKTDG